MAKHVCNLLAVSLVMFSLSVTAVQAGQTTTTKSTEAKTRSAKDSPEIKKGEKESSKTKDDGKRKADLSTGNSSAKSSAPEKLTYTGPEVLDPSRFFGAASMGYAAAKACPEIMSRLFCYCGCDISDDHKSLVDCFTSNHGVDCHICQEEAVLALKLHRENIPLVQIQKEIDQQYTAKYPWKEDSPAYTKYKATRLWKAFDEKVGTTAVGETQKAGPPEPEKCESIKSATAGSRIKDGKWKPVAKAGFHPGACCSKDKEVKK